ncbi:MAG: ATP-binding protein [Atopobiaceae bacterium]|nr:ATP-binding protein [Atopobiaceae bacterium]
MSLIGRKREQDLLSRCLASGKPEFVAVYGRRRVGKTYLIRQYFKDGFAFYATGIASAKTREQLKAFHAQLHAYGDESRTIPKDWFEAFSRLMSLLKDTDVRRDRVSGRIVVFLDELPWMDTARSDFKAALDFFWNGWASTQDDLMLVVCGSATSWMISNLVNDRGGFHNRITRQIQLEPFTLTECEQYYRGEGIVFSRQQVIESYMVFGGIPHYLSLLDRRSSLAQNIDQLCYARTGELRFELHRLYQSLFKHGDRHLAIVRALAARQGGLLRSELERIDGIGGGKALTTALVELEQCGFVRRYRDFTKHERGQHYQVIDPFTLFSLRFVEPGKVDSWLAFVNSPAYAAWTGMAFELTCLLHTDQIKTALGVFGVQSSQTAWRSSKADPGAQIDLLIDRADGVINLCEMKYSSKQFAIDKTYAQTLQNKLTAFREETGTPKAVHLTMVTAAGLAHNAYWNDVQQELTADDLFAF